MTNEDMELVREYVHRQSEPAFETLVSRYVNLVYSAALRQTGNSHLAEEVTQGVFIILARKAGALGPGTIIPSWLYRTAGFVAADILKAQRRRRQREQEAHMPSPLNESENESWQRIAPLLDKAIAGLSEKDRHAIILRFFQNKRLAEIAARLGTNEDAAKKRVQRALEKLRRHFNRHGVSSSASVIASVISSNSVHAAPVALVKSVSNAAIAHGMAAGGSTLTLSQAALKIMAWTKTKTTVSGTIAIIFIALSAGLVIHHAHESRNQTWTKAELTNAGFSSPAAAMKTLLWGVSNGDADTVALSLTPTERTIAENAFHGGFAAKIAEFKGQMTATSFHITVEPGSRDNVSIDLIASNDQGQTLERKYWFKKIGREWKCDQIHPSFDLIN